MRKEHYICDICKKEGNKITNHGQKMTVVFTTEQNEGRSTEPYFDTVVIDICEPCRTKLIEGKMLFASGAMGYNDYRFKD